MSKVTLFSDGGGEKNSSAAGACILREEKTGRELRLVVFLGGATNNESEICGGLMGFSALQVLNDAGVLDGKEVTWVCDSEYVLKSATEYIHNWQRNGWKTAAKQPVKNQGLWRSYLHLARGFRIKPEHVRGHTGHPENEACDRAASWAQEYGKLALADKPEGALIDAGPSAEDMGWVLIDGRYFLSGAREEDPPLEDKERLIEKFSGLGVLELPAPGAAVASKSKSKTKAKSKSKSAGKAKPTVDSLLAELQAVKKKAEELGDDERAGVVVRGIEQILRKLN